MTISIAITHLLSENQRKLKKDNKQNIFMIKMHKFSIRLYTFILASFYVARIIVKNMIRPIRVNKFIAIFPKKTINRK